MEGYVNSTGYYRLEEFGLVHISVRDNARAISARWKDQTLEVSAPRGIEARRLLESLRRFGADLSERRPEPMYHIGQKWQFPMFSIEMRRASAGYNPKAITFGNEGENHHILHLGRDIDLSSPQGSNVASKAILTVAKHYGPQLLKRAIEVADILKVTPAGWCLSSGKRTLGTCNARREINLSYLLTIYPGELVDYVICHELSHLTEMNHSSAFHALCDSYCRRVLSRSEYELRQQLKAYRPPVLK